MTRGARRARLGVALLAAALVIASGAPASPAVDLTGVWSLTGRHSALRTLEGTLPPLKPAARAIYEEHRRAAARGDRSFDGVGRCLPPGLPRLMLMDEPFEILQKPQALYFLFQLNRLPRRAYFGEQLPQDPDPLWLGYSVARWDGGDLVIESAGFNDSTLLDDAGLPHSAALHLTEHYRLSEDGRHLHVRFTIDDPQTFTHPWDTAADYVKRPGYEIPEEVCADHTRLRSR